MLQEFRSFSRSGVGRRLHVVSLYLGRGVQSEPTKVVEDIVCYKCIFEVLKYWFEYSFFIVIVCHKLGLTVIKYLLFWRVSLFLLDTSFHLGSTVNTTIERGLNAAEAAEIANQIFLTEFKILEYICPVWDIMMYLQF
jgi:hypothetical protein